MNNRWWIEVDSVDRHKATREELLKAYELSSKHTSELFREFDGMDLVVDDGTRIGTTISVYELFSRFEWFRERCEREDRLRGSLYQRFEIEP